MLASIWFQTPEASVRSLFHDPPNTHNAVSLASFVVVYFFLAAWTFGLYSSNGLFIPTLLTGAAWGRLVSIGLYYMFPSMVSTFAYLIQHLHTKNVFLVGINVYINLLNIIQLGDK